ncbi:hypothetical protein [Streptomyces sp. NPDC051569]|uniref:hypothetical protein n=1 Tax=Streptomyces sp. NPDC051569 TaxID=3365661 RepID=UPI0037B67B23
MDDTLPAHAGGAATRHRVVPVRLTGQDRPRDNVPPQWHRGMTLLAAISLFIGTRGAWTRAVEEAALPLAAVISVCYAGILICGVLALSVRGRKALGRVDLAVLVLAITLVICRHWMQHIGTDEGVLTTQAASEILRGHPIYERPWPWLFDREGVGVTKTMSGGGDYTYAYPPLAALLTAPVYALVHSRAAATGVTTGALIVGTVVLWRLLPATWRPAATAVCLGFGMLPNYARSGYPAIVAFALLVPVVVSWPATGAGGRLGRYGVLRAGCLGAACAAQQLSWFLLPFLVVGVYAVRRGELGGRAALGVIARYTGIAALTWSLINAYFAVQDFPAWLTGTFLPMTQGAILHGQGVMGISYYLTHGSGRLDFYSYASLLLLLGLLAALTLFVRRLGPALTVLPWLAFYLATRSQDGYFLLMTPLWLAAAATVPGTALATAWQPRITRVSGPGAKAALAAGLLVPAVLCVGVAATSPPPLRLSVAPEFTDQPRRGITSVVVHAVNTTGTALAPHFASRTGQGASDWWPISSGPAALGPHASAAYVLTPPGGFRALPRGRARLHLIAVTGTPMTITTVLFPVRSATSPAHAGPSAPSRAAPR